MFEKLLIASIVFLEILKVPGAEDKVRSLSISGSTAYQEQVSAINSPEINLDEIPPLPIRRSGVKDPYAPAQGEIVIDIPTSKVLFVKGGKDKFAMASLTKIMTALVSLENYKLQDVITVPPEAPFLRGSKINLRSEEKLTVESLMYGLLLYSGNDAAHTLASKMGQEQFVAKMNKKAKDLGLKSLNYADPTGLDERNTTSMQDLAFLASFALRNPKFAQIVRTNEIEISSVDGRTVHPLKNSNKLLREYPGTFGIKTGYTEEAGHCLIAAVERNGHKLLSVILNHPADQFKESEKLLDWAFSAYKW